MEGGRSTSPRPYYSMEAGLRILKLINPRFYQGLTNGREALCYEAKDRVGLQT